MKTFTVNTDTKELNVKITLDTVTDYNAENGFTKDSDEFQPNWVCALVDVEIGDKTTSGEVQWDSQNNEYSTSCDGNMFNDAIKRALLANFDDKKLYDDHGLPTDFCINLTENVLPKINEQICEFGEKEVEEFKAL